MIWRFDFSTNKSRLISHKAKDSPDVSVGVPTTKCVGTGNRKVLILREDPAEANTKYCSIP